MRQITPHIGYTFLFLLLTGAGFAQRHGHNGSAQAPATPPPVLKATVDKRQIFIGQPIQLMLEATVTGKDSLLWPSLDSLPHFEFVEKGKMDSSINHPDEHYYRQYLIVTSFDSGSWSIPRLAFTLGTKKYYSDSVRIEVSYTKFDPNQDYHDIRDIIDIPNPYAKWIPWAVGAATLISLALVVWLVRKKKLLSFAAPEAEAPRRSPYEEAIWQLEELQRQRLSEYGDVKVFYTRLNEILRQFVLRRLGISSLAETNEELIGKLRKLPLPSEEFSPLEEALRMTDFVKFAKYQPGVSDNEYHFGVIRSSVERLHTFQLAKEAEALKREEANAAAAAGSDEKTQDKLTDKTTGV